MTLSLWIAFCTYHPYQSKRQIQQTINGSSPKNETDELLNCKQKFLDQYFNKILDEKEIICYIAPGDIEGT